MQGWFESRKLVNRIGLVTHSRGEVDLSLPAGNSFAKQHVPSDGICEEQKRCCVDM